MYFSTTVVLILMDVELFGDVVQGLVEGSVMRPGSRDNQIVKMCLRGGVAYASKFCVRCFGS